MEEKESGSGSEMKISLEDFCARNALEDFCRQSAEHQSGDGGKVDHTNLQTFVHQRINLLHALCSTLIEPDIKIEEMINRTFDFLGSFELSGNYDLSNPSAILATLDPTAEWLKSWLHSSSIRLKVINALHRNQISYGKELSSFACEKMPKMRSADRIAPAFHRQ